LCPNSHRFLQSKAWKAAIIPVGFLSRPPNLYYA
jgi:hypothetical protein